MSGRFRRQALRRLRNQALDQRMKCSKRREMDEPFRLWQFLHVERDQRREARRLRFHQLKWNVCKSRLRILTSKFTWQCSWWNVWTSSRHPWSGPNQNFVLCFAMLASTPGDVADAMWWNNFSWKDSRILIKLFLCRSFRVLPGIKAPSCWALPTTKPSPLSSPPMKAPAGNAFPLVATQTAPPPGGNTACGASTIQLPVAPLKDKLISAVQLAKLIQLTIQCKRRCIGPGRLSLSCRTT